jgi:hypothetical protein
MNTLAPMIVIQQRYKLQSIKEGFPEALFPTQSTDVPPRTTPHPHVDRVVIVIAPKAMIHSPATTSKRNPPKGP